MGEQTTIRFIDVVHHNDILWNIRNRSYSDTMKIQDVWNDVGRQFFMTGDEANAKFRLLREKYRRECNKENVEARCGGRQIEGDQWVFKKHLQFLDDVYRRRRFGSSLSRSSSRGKQLSSISTIPEETLPNSQCLLLEGLGVLPSTSLNKAHSSTQWKDKYTQSCETVSDQNACVLPSTSLHKAHSSTQWKDKYSESCETLSDQYACVLPSTPSNKTLSSAQLKDQYSQSDQFLREELPPLPSSSSSISVQRRARNKRIVDPNDVLRETTESLIHATNPFDSCVEYIRQTFVELPKKQARNFEKEIMNLAFQYKFGDTKLEKTWQ